MLTGPQKLAYIKILGVWLCPYSEPKPSLYFACFGVKDNTSYHAWIQNVL